MIFKDKWFILFILLVATILSPLDFYIVNLALPSIQHSLQSSNSELQMIVSFYTCAYAVFQISGGRFGDIYGRKKIFIIGLIGFVSSSALCGIAQSPAIMIIGRVLQGVSGAVMIPQVLAILHTLFDEKEKRLVMALYSFTFGIAAALGQYLGALLIEWNIFDLGWRVIFLVNLPVGLFALIMAIIALPKQEVKISERVDYIGTILLSVGLISFIYPLTTIVEHGIDTQTIFCLLGSVLFLYSFVKEENKRKREGKSILVDFAILKFKNLKLGVMTSFLYYASGVFYLVLGIYLQEELHWTSMQAGKAIIPFGIGFIIMSLCSSIISKYFKQTILSLGLVVYGTGFMLLLYTLYHFNSFVFKLDLFVIGCGMGLTLASVVRLSLTNIPIKFAGLASGVVNCGLQIGSAFGVAAIGSVFFGIANTVDYTLAFAVVLVLITVLLLIALLLSFGIVKVLKE
ncbi:MFS transporter [Myroides marinus]|uniref:Multidrug transporter n=1 Tax=Myroides marinus TaxID=703342 RepID=A0A161SJC6_9FLAO|nr:MFS transporter [Myroides marinus]KUF38285.1 multidrug transporter [Myroides marinus]KZE81885.1 multidrug transporter [Myroides marinus]MDM1362211.1 MFS transporter [Myroides marinus]MDM1380087.1 MFS transporter [Myroides marinus]MDM1387356.1 MFS transporter [Myroides marinus]